MAQLSWSSVALRALLLASVFAMVAVIGSAITHTRRPTPTAPVLVSINRTEDATLRVSGALSADVAREISAMVGQSAVRMVVLLSAADAQTCEDLGRQLRELHRTFGVDDPFVVLARDDDKPAIRDFLRFERLGRATLVTMQERPLVDNRAVSTPAAMIAKPSGEIIVGVAHRYRAQNLRLVSFSDQLGLRSTSDSLKAAGEM